MRRIERHRQRLRRPTSLSGTSVCPWMRFSTFQSVSPWRMMQMRVLMGFEM
jgi:hypothetical protein